MNPDYARLAEAVAKARRAHVDPRTGQPWSQKYLGELTGLGRTTIQRIERGEPDSSYPTATTIKALQAAFEWGTGSVKAILEGGDPLPDDAVPRIVEIPTDREGETILVQLVAGASELTMEQRRQVLALVRRLQAEALAEDRSQ